MKKVLTFLVLATASASAFATCSDGLEQKHWDGTAAGYCKIFFPDCGANALGRRLSYSRELADSEIICLGTGGAYTHFYKVTLVEANDVFKTSFDKMGVNYSSDLSQWLYDNCAKICVGAQPEAKADDAPSAAPVPETPAE